VSTPYSVMDGIFRRRLSCFYCGEKSRLIRSPTIKQWRCTHCDAMNYLDEVRYLFSKLYSVANAHNRMAKSPIPQSPIRHSSNKALRPSQAPSHTQTLTRRTISSAPPVSRIKTSTSKRWRHTFPTIPTIPSMPSMRRNIRNLRQT
jgi:hypothetical protein